MAFPSTGREALAQDTKEKAFHGGTPYAGGNILPVLLGRKKNNFGTMLVPGWGGFVEWWQEKAILEGFSS